MDGQLDKLMIRRLDGEITADEQLELDRALLRSPDARARFERYRRIDEMAAAVIHEIADHAPASDMNVKFASVARRTSSHRHWFAYGAAMAACLALVMVWWVVDRPGSMQPVPQRELAGVPAGQVWPGAEPRDLPQVGAVPHGASPQFVGMPPASRQALGAAPGSDVGVWQVMDPGQPVIDRRTDRNLLLVPGSDGNYYLINLDRVREVRQPGRGGASRGRYEPI